MARAFPDKPVHLFNWTFSSHADLAACVEKAAEMDLPLEEYLRLLVVHHHQVINFRHFHA